jgi:hypothetical protein
MGGRAQPRLVAQLRDSPHREPAEGDARAAVRARVGARAGDELSHHLGAAHLRRPGAPALPLRNVRAADGAVPADVRPARQRVVSPEGHSAAGLGRGDRRHLRGHADRSRQLRGAPRAGLVLQDLGARHWLHPPLAARGAGVVVARWPHRSPRRRRRDAAREALLPRWLHVDARLQRRSAHRGRSPCPVPK